LNLNETVSKTQATQELILSSSNSTHSQDLTSFIHSNGEPDFASATPQRLTNMVASLLRGQEELKKEIAESRKETKSTNRN
jgi:GTP cyclohydrolase I